MGSSGLHGIMVVYFDFFWVPSVDHRLWTQYHRISLLGFRQQVAVRLWFLRSMYVLGFRGSEMLKPSAF